MIGHGTTSIKVAEGGLFTYRALRLALRILLGRPHRASANCVRPFCSCPGLLEPRDQSGTYYCGRHLSEAEFLGFRVGLSQQM
jgi:hypothetical protein